MKFQTKMHEVDAISVERVVSLAASDFGKLPVWIKKKFEESCLFIGKHHLIVNDIYHCQIADNSNILVFNSSKQIEVMSKKDFFDRYEDMWDKNNNSIV
ncbi:MAG: hypothetical protein VX125_07945 [Pseudomonadota bacterium]|nr:hypothetical protein [Pseudomonadota bacterium]